jgi:outer membrane immunogenic protein
MRKSELIPTDRWTSAGLESALYRDRHDLLLSRLEKSNGSGQHRQGLQGTMGFQMKKIILATLLAGLGSTAALAADLGARSYSKAPATMAAVNNWSGFYVGGNVGYGWGGKTDLSYLPTPAAFEASNTTFNSLAKGVVGGAQIGYNWQIGSLVTGLEADLQGSGVRGSVRQQPDQFSSFSFRSAEQNLSWFGTVRGRLGVTVTPDLLLYGTGGLGYGHAEGSTNTFFSNTFQFPGSFGKTKLGWAAGAGAEWMIARNWSAKIEYLHMDLGSESTTVDAFPIPNPPARAVSTWHNHYDIVRAGVNYHFN